REYKCGHFRWIAYKWCNLYEYQDKRCEPDIMKFETALQSCGMLLLVCVSR
ncbi:hypothetical protein QBC35DRAFT_396204, partial [Podospora australis]